MSLTDLRPMTAWSADGKRSRLFRPSPKNRLVDNEVDEPMPDVIREMRMHGSTFEFIANVLGVAPNEARELIR